MHSVLPAFGAPKKCKRFTIVSSLAPTLCPSAMATQRSIYVRSALFWNSCIWIDSWRVFGTTVIQVMNGVLKHYPNSAFVFWEHVGLEAHPLLQHHTLTSPKWSRVYQKIHRWGEAFASTPGLAPMTTLQDKVTLATRIVVELCQTPEHAMLREARKEVQGFENQGEVFWQTQRQATYPPATSFFSSKSRKCSWKS